MKYIVLAVSSLLILSCGDNGHKHDHDHDHNHTGHKHTEKKELKDYKTHDPVCGMERESSWTHFSVYNSDTVLFCAEMCKKGFDLNPDKYVAKP